MILPIRGFRYHVAIDGSPGGGPTVVLLHGFGGSAADWAPLMRSLRAEGFAGVAIDLPGHGQTETPPDPARFTLAETTKDLVAIASTLGVERGHWLGYSMGGRVALWTAILEPGAVGSLVLESASPGIGDPEARRFRRDQDDRLAEQILRHGVEWFAEIWEEQSIFATQKRLSPEQRRALRERRLGNTAAGLAGSLRGIGQGVQEDATPHLGAIACPTLLVTGAEDEKYTAIASAMAAAIRGSVHLTIPGTGHNIHVERPETFERAVMHHLRRASGAATSAPPRRPIRASG